MNLLLILGITYTIGAVIGMLGFPSYKSALMWPLLPTSIAMSLLYHILKFLAEILNMLAGICFLFSANMIRTIVRSSYEDIKNSDTTTTAK